MSRKNETLPPIACEFFEREHNWWAPNKAERRQMISERGLPVHLWNAFDQVRPDGSLVEHKTSAASDKRLPFFGTYGTELELAELLGNEYSVVFSWIKEGKVDRFDIMLGGDFIAFVKRYGRLQYQTRIKAPATGDYERAVLAGKTRHHPDAGS